MTRAIVIGAGHNGLVAACYLARAGLDVLVLEQAPAAGGGSRTAETVPGHRFDLHSVAHNILNMTSIPAELRLAEAGLEYREMDPFAVALFADDRRVRFHRSVERTVASIGEEDPAEADAYRAFVAEATPLVDLAVAGLDATGPGARARALPAALALLRRPGATRRTLAALLGPYGALLRSRLPSGLTQGPVAAFAAHASAGPDTAGGGFFAFWQAAYHRFGQWHAVGGSQGLVDALERRLRAHGGGVRCGAPVARIETAGGRVRSVALEDGERLRADVVVAATDPQHALLELLAPPLSGRAAADLAAAHRGNAVQMLVHVATDRLPPYAGARPGDWNGLQSYVDDLDGLSRSFAAAEGRRVPAPPAAAYAFTPSALDPSLAPPGRHTVYLACPAAPFAVDGGWERAAPALVEDLLAQVEARAPGFRASIQGLSVRTPDLMARELRWPGAHPMHLDVTPDQLGPLRPTPALAGHRTPIAGLYVGGAGTAPTGGIAGLPGRAAARAALQDLGHKRSRWPRTTRAVILPPCPPR
jgi:phytoene dehydrogenase-like protein